MDTLIHGYMPQSNDFQLNCHSKPVVFPQETHGFGCKFPQYSHPTNGSVSGSGSFPVNQSSSNGIVSEPSNSEEDGENVKENENDHSDVFLKFISQVLMEEEDLENKPCMLNDCLALQATEKSLYEALINNDNIDQNPESPNHHFTKNCSINSNESSSSSNSTGSNWDPYNLESLLIPSSDASHPSLPALNSELRSFESSSVDPFWGSNLSSNESRGELAHFLFKDVCLSHDSEPQKKTLDCSNNTGKNNEGRSPNNWRGKKNRYREEDSDLMEEHRSSKQLAENVGTESEPIEMYDHVLLCSNSKPLEPVQSEAKKKLQQSKGSANKGRPKGGKKQGSIIKEVVDLRNLLMQCAQAVASYDSRTVNELLTRIRQHSSPTGDGTERLAHYFANALEARLAGTGTGSYFMSTRRSAAEILKAYKTFLTACPFRKMSNLLANKTIRKRADGATTLHIVDFGILYGFQWPCLIQALSERPGGPPKLRVTGIDFPQPGFHPAERVEETGRRLAKYCERFGVPFEYIAIAQKWETIKLEDVKIEKDEFLVVNSLYRLQNVPDETVTASSPRDTVLKLIRKMNPDMFIMGLVSGTYNTPFFVTRFREALFHFSAMFDLFEATLPREDPDRQLFEEEVLGKDTMNVIACEGAERVDRPETYKQWHVRNVRAGFRQSSLDEEIVKCVRSKVKKEYHKDFSVDEDGKWMLQGWKGRVIHAMSLWEPAHK